MKFVINLKWSRRIRYVYLAVAIIYSGVSAADRIVRQRLKYGQKTKRSYPAHASKRAGAVCQTNRRIHRRTERLAKDVSEADPV